MAAAAAAAAKGRTTSVSDPEEQDIHPGLDAIGKPSACPYHVGTTEKSPHMHFSRDDPSGLCPRTNPKIHDSVLSMIGNTPLIRCSRLAAAHGIECELLAKCEFFNAGGSVKDRIGRRMLEVAEREGRIRPGDTIIEPTSGNTGIGLALSCAVKGYRCIIVMPEKMSQEKVDVLRALGAEIVRTPTSASFDSPESHIGVALQLNKDIPRSHILDQYGNPHNPLAHYDGTAEEILESCDGQVDALVAGAGTGGTISGIARKLKEKCPGVQIVGVDPYGSLLAQPEALNETKVTYYEVEGIGYDFVPTVLDRSLVDRWEKTHDHESFTTARQMLKLEGLLCGGSSGTAMAAALKVAKTMKKGQKCVVVCPDSIRNYMTKFLNNDWMIERGFMEADVELPFTQEWWYNLPIASLPAKFPMVLSPTISCGDAVNIMQREGFDQMPVLDDKGSILGMVTEANVLAQLMRKRVKKDDTVDKVLYTRFKTVGTDTTIGAVSQMLDKRHFVLVTSEQQCYTTAAEVQTKVTIFSIVTRIDILNFIMKRDSSGAASPT